MTPWNANKVPSAELLNKTSVCGFLSRTLVDGCWWSFPYGSVKNRGSVVRVRVQEQMSLAFHAKQRDHDIHLSTSENEWLTLGGDGLARRKSSVAPVLLFSLEYTIAGARSLRDSDASR
jgi:hypothetical protein